MFTFNLDSLFPAGLLPNAMKKAKRTLDFRDVPSPAQTGKIKGKSATKKIIILQVCRRKLSVIVYDEFRIQFPPGLAVVSMVKIRAQ